MSDKLASDGRDRMHTPLQAPETRTVLRGVLAWNMERVEMLMALAHATSKICRMTNPENCLHAMRIYANSCLQSALIDKAEFDAFIQDLKGLKTVTDFVNNRELQERHPWIQALVI